MLMVKGETSRGQLTQAVSQGASKALTWSNGDVWHCYEGRVIGKSALYSQSLTKALRDKAQDAAYRSRTASVLKCVSKQGFCMPSNLEANLMQYIGNDLHYVQVYFESDSTRADILDAVSRRHPRVAFRHSWVKPSNGSCGQRAIINGEAADEGCFNRHISMVSIA